MDYYLFFDTETTGLPKNYKAPVTDVENWPRIIQLAYAVYDGNGNLLRSKCELIKPDGWVIPKERFWIENGYSTEKSEAFGVPLAPVIEKFIEEINNCKYIVAHNMSYDEKIAGAEMVRLGIFAQSRPIKVCTKELSTNLCKIPHQSGRGYKWPTLTELHQYIFKKGFDGAHDALNDVRACADCFFELKKAKLITI